MQTLAIDIETFSSNDLIKSGVYRYVEANDFTILLFAYSWNNGPVALIDLASSEEIPTEIKTVLTDQSILKTAYNANFERTCITRHFNITLHPSQWECSMAKASMLGLPLSLDAASKALKLQQGKDAAGKALIKYFSVPCKPTKANNNRIRNLPEHDPEKWNRFKEYCIQDVVVEQSIRQKICFYTIPETEKKLWRLDQKINDKGVLLDPVFIRNALQIDSNNTEKLTTEAIKLTRLENPNSAAQLKEWISDATGEKVDKLTKEAVPELLKQTDSDIVKRVLQIRQEMAKTSIKKYEAMRNVICTDNRVRGLLQYYGANRTGRWAGRLIQVQNLPQNHLMDLDLAREIVRDNDPEMLELLFGNIPDTLSQLIRTSFVAPAGSRFIVADFSAIEARVIAWLAGERWRLDVFNTHGKIYEASAAHMFKVPIEQVTKGSVLRQKGKMAELALGYQGGPNAIINIETSNRTPKENRIPEEELPKLVAMWRHSNKAIVQFWNTVEEAAIGAVHGDPSTIKYGIRFFTDKNIFFIMLPSGRMLSYLRPKLKPNKFGGESLCYKGMNQTTKQWGFQDTYGGKLVENIVQAVARDCLADAMLRLDEAGYNLVMHVHDEVVMEMPYGKGSTEEVNKIMGQSISWAKGLPLKAESYETEFYKKD